MVGRFQPAVLVDAGAILPAEAGRPSAGSPNDPAATLARFSPPRIISELSDPNADESEPTLSEDELEIYFRSDRLARRQIFVATRQSSSDRFSTPTLVSELVSETGDSFSPELSRDGRTLFFVSDRPGGQGSEDMYVTTRRARGDAWSPPESVSELNTAACEIDPGPALELNSMILTRCNEIGFNHLLVTQRTGPDKTWDPPLDLPQLNSDQKEGDPAFARDGLALYFATTRDSPYGDNRADIWRSSRASLNDPFEQPTPVEELNILAVDDQDPWLSNDEKHIVFTSARDRSPREIYEAWR